MSLILGLLKLIFSLSVALQKDREFTIVSIRLIFIFFRIEKEMISDTQLFVINNVGGFLIFIGLATTGLFSLSVKLTYIGIGISKAIVSKKSLDLELAKNKL